MDETKKINVMDSKEFFGLLIVLTDLYKSSTEFSVMEHFSIVVFQVTSAHAFQRK